VFYENKVLKTFAKVHKKLSPFYVFGRFDIN